MSFHCKSLVHKDKCPILTMEQEAVPKALWEKMNLMTLFNGKIKHLLHCLTING